jgi:transcriptional regulator with XRE-family HTH domain
MKPSPHHPLDIALGARIRLRRRELHLSQVQLSCQLGVTFQQVQKYERGANRVSFSRLAGIAQALRCGVTDIVGDLDQAEPSPLFSRQADLLSKPGAGELLEAYVAIRTEKLRRIILDLVRQLAEK